MTKEYKRNVARSLRASADRWYAAAAFVFGVAIASSAQAFAKASLGTWIWGFASAALFAGSVVVYFGGGGRRDVAQAIEDEISKEIAEEGSDVVE